MKLPIDTADFLAHFGLQLLALIGPAFFFGWMINIMERRITRAYMEKFGWRALLVTAWIGTPLHELSHALFCVIFLHRIVEFKPLSPDPNTGTLGYVAHTHGKGMLWPVFGKIFIGLAPFYMGLLVIWIMAYFLIPETGITNVRFLSKEKAQYYSPMPYFGDTLETVKDFFGKMKFDDMNQDAQKIVYVYSSEDEANLDIIAVIKDTISQSATFFYAFVTNTNLYTSWKFWLFFYLSTCIYSHLSVSSADMKTAREGLLFFVIFWFVINSLMLQTGYPYGKITEIAVELASWMGVLCLFGMGVLFLFHLVSLALLYPFRNRFSVTE